MIETLKENFPQLSDTAAAAIVYAFTQWQADWSDFRLADCEDEALIGFAAGWLARPADYTG